MKLHLLLSAAMMMLSASAKNVEPQLRGVSVESGDAFHDGYNAGKDAANDVWDDMGDDCANAFNFEDEAKKAGKKKGWNTDGRNWKEKAYNEGAREGMKTVVDEKEKECLNDNPEECIGLGEAASSMIAFKYCGSFGATSQTNYKKECRDVAINQCVGGVYGKVKSGCGAPDTSTLKELQGQCRATVDDLLGIDNNNDRASKRACNYKVCTHKKSSDCTCASNETCNKGGEIGSSSCKTNGESHLNGCCVPKFKVGEESHAEE